jgi:hypothetical protein
MYEHPSPGDLLLRGPAWRNQRGGAQHPLRHPAAPASRLKSAKAFWERDKISGPSICLPAGEAISKNFQRDLNRLGIDWFPSIEINSLDTVETYVADGFGIGLTVSIPKTRMSPKVRSIALEDFAPVVLGAL